MTVLPGNIDDHAQHGTHRMNHGRLMAILAVIVIGLFPVTTRADSLAIRNCTWCHGPSAKGYTPAPELAGQRSKYIENQLASFSTHTRDNPLSKLYMWGAASNLNPQTVHALATYFSTLPPRAANDGDRELIATGRTIYQVGIADANIAACVACHGPSAQGVGDIPRLGGLAYVYLRRRLQQWGEGYHATAKHPMPRIAAKLSIEQIEALASYLSFVR
jgi:cytochrome c553